MDSINSYQLGYFNAVPVDVTKQVFVFAIESGGVNFENISRLARVCKKFQQIIYDTSVIKEIFQASDFEKVLNHTATFIAYKILTFYPTIDPSIQNNYAVFIASQKGHAAFVKVLLANKSVNAADQDNRAIRFASQKGHTEVVKLLLENDQVNPADKHNDAICFASANGHAKVVELLLKSGKVDPAACYNYPIRFASANGHAEVVELLLKSGKVDPAESNHEALREAIQRGHKKVVKVLLAEKGNYDKYEQLCLLQASPSEIIKVLLSNSEEDSDFLMY